LNPWDVAAGSLMITEAGGLIGNFTGEPDFLHRREVVAGNPKIYGQLVHLLTPFTKDAGAPSAASATSPASSASPATTPSVPAPRKTLSRRVVKPRA
jgi:myo-inositol-1(or 4)-monophosphatase